ncbi:hypothetical protein ACJRO7_000967 [Eucalyptus globulus]|uniref:GTP cyclohydrolase II domain-containing protein n=1 Tax=Eucalyptus globulus TaxID=34317 RepID=A0ABD3LSN2_EUCGL
MVDEILCLSLALVSRSSKSSNLLLQAKPSLQIGFSSDLTADLLGSRLSSNGRGVVAAKAAVIPGGGETLSYPVGIRFQPDAIAFGAFAADTAPISTSFPIKAGLASTPEAIEDIRQGKIVLVADDEDGENEGDLILAAEKATLETMAFIVKYGNRIVCVSMKEGDLERLQLPLMVKFNRPGHIFPLKYRKGGVLKRAGHTEASIDLAMLAGMEPVAVLCEVVDDEGSMARLPKLHKFAQRENLKIVSIADLIRYRWKRDKLIEHAVAARLPTMWGPFIAHCYRSIKDGNEHTALVKGDIGDGQDVLVRVHSECLTGDIFGSARCDCGNQLALAMQQIEAAGRGVPVKSIVLGHKLRAYNLQDDGRDTVEANMLRDLGFRTMKLMMDNPSEYVGILGETRDTWRRTLQDRAHYGADVKGRFSNLISKNSKPSSTVSSDPAVSDS